MKEKIELSKVREFGDIIGDTFVIVRQNFKPLISSYLVICGVFVLAGTLINIVSNSQLQVEGGASIFTAWGILNLILQLANYAALVVTTISFLAIYKQNGNQAPGVLDVWAYFKYYFFRVFGTQILLTIAIVIGFFLCVIPGIYLMAVFTLVTPIMIIENTNGEYAMRKAFKIIKNNWWFTFGVLLLVSIITAVAIIVCLIPAMIIYGSGQWLTGANLNTTYIDIIAIVTHICQALYLLPIIAITLVYYTLTEHAEGSSLIERIKMFGKNDPSSDQHPQEQY